ncbi:YjaG family protein [Thorsellia kenyensis]|uniref:YjaG family protein n=1 Tax=Thorsellia kenyensis TaxID=1549888 RepID=A0ABV6CH04_9GAMM
MFRNPLQLRLKKLSPQQLQLFMLVLCERMAINYGFFALNTEQKVNFDKFKQIMNLLWESLSVKNVQINFDGQLEKLELLIPQESDYSIYAVHPAIDACEALSEALHAKLTDDVLEHALSVSQISLKTVCDVYLAEHDIEITEAEANELEPIKDEWDNQWEIFRLILDTPFSASFVKELKEEVSQIKESQIGLFLS